MLLISRRHAELAAQDVNGDVSVRRVVLEVAAQLEVEQHDRHPAAPEQRDLPVPISRWPRLSAQARTLGVEVEQVLAPDEALARRRPAPFVGGCCVRAVLGLHDPSLAQTIGAHRRGPWQSSVLPLERPPEAAGSGVFGGVLPAVRGDRPIHDVERLGDRPPVLIRCLLDVVDGDVGLAHLQMSIHAATGQTHAPPPCMERAVDGLPTAMPAD